MVWEIDGLVGFWLVCVCIVEEFVVFRGEVIGGFRFSFE